jgi:FkbM family methyltransferase
MSLGTLFKRYNPKKLLGLRYGRLFYSQFGEDVFLETLIDINEPGVYVDVGAYHPWKLSNTCRLYHLGWRGINIEPQILNYGLFVKHRPRDINLNLAVGKIEGSGVLKLCDTNTTLLGTDVIGRDLSSSRIQEVQIKSLKSIFAANIEKGSPIGFMTIDCEGFDLNVLESNDWNEYRPRIIAVEDHSENVESETTVYLEKQGYSFIHRLAVTSFYKDIRSGK